mgnify:CR=1 FL=1
MALEPDNFRSRPLARQLGASAFLKAVVSQRMELFGVCAPGPQVEPCQPITGSFHPERKSWNSGGSVEVPNGPVPPGVSTQQRQQRSILIAPAGACATSVIKWNPPMVLTM